MGLFAHVKSKAAKRKSKEIRPYYRAFLFGCVALYGMYAVVHHDPSSVKLTGGHGRRQLEESVFNSAESSEQCRLDENCFHKTEEDQCESEQNCDWYGVLQECRHSSEYCGNSSVTKSRCDEWCPTYNWTYYNHSSGRAIQTFNDSNNWTLLFDDCDDPSIASCNCTGSEIVVSHNECEADIFGVPESIRDEIGHSGWMLVIVLYGFIGIAIVCDTYFEPSLEIISTKLKLTPDVAGATFMAMGSSAPELFTSLSDNFITKNNVGVGTIVGSALFNILIIVALSAFVARPPKNQPQDQLGIIVDWRPVVRDVVFYCIAIGCLVGFIIDESVYWWEALIMIIVYIIYIVYMTQNPKIIAACDRHAARHKESAVAPLNALPVTAVVSATKVETAVTVVGNASDSDVPEGPETKAAEKRNKSSLDLKTTLSDANTDTKDDSDAAKKEEGEEGGGDDDDDDDDDDWRVWPTKEEWAEKGCGSKSWFIFISPLHVLFWLTIPNCGNPNSECLQKLYPLTFINCVLWMAILCAIETTLVTWLGCWWGISAPVMGIVILAIGTSVPDAIASMIVARGGQGDMAIANAVGSNVFDILFGLGVPWLIADLVFQSKNACGQFVGIFVDVDGIVGAALILYGTVVFYLVVLMGMKWKLNKWVGVVFVITYCFIITFLMLNEYCVGFTWKYYNENCS